jgi:hypothetical protein
MCHGGKKREQKILERCDGIFFILFAFGGSHDTSFDQGKTSSCHAASGAALACWQRAVPVTGEGQGAGEG